MFGQTLARDLMDWQFQGPPLLQYVDDLLVVQLNPLSPGLQSP
jgi:hypothetical protein